MDRTHMQKVLDYIEAHLKDDRQGVLDNVTLAGLAGYSEYHFLRVFHRLVGLTPADYIRKRRISEIVRRIGEGNRPMSDIAFEYGFNSKENFTRAFKKEHGILPTEFRAYSAVCDCMRLLSGMSPSQAPRCRSHISRTFRWSPILVMRIFRPSFGTSIMRSNGQNACRAALWQEISVQWCGIGKPSG